MADYIQYWYLSDSSILLHKAIKDFSSDESKKMFSRASLSKIRKVNQVFASFHQDGDVNAENIGQKIDAFEAYMERKYSAFRQNKTINNLILSCRTESTSSNTSNTLASNTGNTNGGIVNEPSLGNVPRVAHTNPVVSNVNNGASATNTMTTSIWNWDADPPLDTVEKAPSRKRKKGKTPGRVHLSSR